VRKGAAILAICTSTFSLSHFFSVLIVRFDIVKDRDEYKKMACETIAEQQSMRMEINKLIAYEELKQTSSLQLGQIKDLKAGLENCQLRVSELLTESANLRLERDNLAAELKAAMTIIEQSIPTKEEIFNLVKSKIRAMAIGELLEKDAALYRDDE
jgi:regulator of replication initiation timing